MTWSKETANRGGAALLMLILAFADPWSSYSLFRCGDDPIARRSCCCPMIHHESETPAGGVRAVQGCCCEIETVLIAPAESEAARFDAGKTSVFVATFVMPFGIEAARAPLEPAPVAREPRGAGPPIILLKRSLQI